MCGICGVATSVGNVPSAGAADIVRMRDRMAHRGPDGWGLWPRDRETSHVSLGHRRLAVIDPSAAGAQPFASDDGKCVLLYNGALYNDAELRAELGGAVDGQGIRFHTQCDTETVLAALRTWRAPGLARLRGMYAIAFYDARFETLLLARDPLGIKPLYWWEQTRRGLREIAFASEIGSLLAHPSIAARPDLVSVSAYLTTIRTTLDDRTLYQGIKTLRPGEAIEFDLRTAALITRRASHTSPERSEGETACAELAHFVRGSSVTPPDSQTQQRFTNEVRAAVIDSVSRHLRADVRTCCLLSGGLDSTIVTALAAKHAPKNAPPLRTYCSGAPGGESDDLSFARLAAARHGTIHAEAPITRELFIERWPAMVRAMKSPLSTPNEVAINEVARRLRADGVVVALSGEGADELFGGYGIALDNAAAYIASRNAEHQDGGGFQLQDAAWIPPESKGAILNEPVLRHAEGDEVLFSHYRDEFTRLREESDDELSAHLRFSRRINLAGLLQRLDTATMLEGVEGRTPFADASLAALAESLPMCEKYQPPDAAPPPGAGIGAPRTKLCLRRAFADDLPPEVASREKASFPLPFQDWIGDGAPLLRESPFARELFTPAAIETVAAQPARLWRFAWPMMNLALWGKTF